MSQRASRFSKPGRPPEFPIEAAAALFLERQQLARPRGAPLTSARLEKFVAEVGGLQIDSINVLDRAHLLTLWSRFGPFDRAALDRMIYRRRVLFEYWAHAACFVPRSHLPGWRRAMLNYRTSHTGWSHFLRKHGRLRDEIETRIREQGPVLNADFERARKGTTGWWSWKPATHALHGLWMSGRTLVHSRQHFQKRFDLASNVIAEFESVTPLSPEEFPRWHLRRGLHAMGAATEMDLNKYLTSPRTPATTRRRVLQAMVRSGEVVEVAIEGHRSRWFALPEDVPELARAARRRSGRGAALGTTLLSPFDSFLWHRGRTRTLFAFDYTIEVYVPESKRVHGYYSLPILHHGRLIGRLDAKAHREARQLEVRRVHFEPWFAAGETPPLARWGEIDRERAFAELTEAVRSLATFAGADRIRLGRVSPSALRAPLARAFRTA